MSWSLGEVRALSIKAARGAWMPWGLAEEAGFAVQWLEERGLPGVEAMAAYLEWRTKNGRFHVAMCPLETGAAISDCGRWKDFSKRETCQPLLLAPFIASACGEGTTELVFSRHSILISATNARCDVPAGCLHAEPVSWQSRTGSVTLEKPALKTRVPDSAKPFIETLSRHAHITYAPATEASRLKGAGAGLNDND